MTFETEEFSGLESGILLATILPELDIGEAFSGLGEKLPFCFDGVVIPVLVAIPSIPSVAYQKKY